MRKGSPEEAPPQQRLGLATNNLDISMEKERAMETEILDQMLAILFAKHKQFGHHYQPPSAEEGVKRQRCQAIEEEEEEEG